MTPAELVALQRLLDARRWAEARPFLERLWAAQPGNRAVLHPLCEAEILDGAPQQALQRIVAAGARGEPEADFLHARAQAALGQDAAARAELRALRARLPQASASLERQLAVLEERAGDLDAAIVALERAAQAAPADVAGHVELARVCARAGRHPATRAALSHALEAGPRTAGEWSAIGHLFAELLDWPRATEALERAALLDPAQAGVGALAAFAHREQGDEDAAQRVLARATAARPDDLHLAVATRLALPQVYADPAHLERSREGFAQGLAELEAQVARFLPQAPQVLDLPHANFLLAYQGRDDRELQQRYSAFLATLTRAALPDLHEPIAPRRGTGARMRVGFASSAFHASTVGHYFSRWITGLDAAACERFVYHTGAFVDDATRALAARSEHFALLRDGVADSARRIKADALDVLVWLDVGMSAASSAYATLRLAPVQLAAWGHPVTTGSAAIDGFLTVGAMEPDDGAAHYSEPLVALPMPGVDYPLPAPAAAPSREQLGLPAARRLYACPQSLFKIHPDMDAVLAGIAARDPGATLVFFEGAAPAITQRFRGRLERALRGAGVATKEPVRFLPRQAPEGFRALLAACDVVVDTLHWSGGNTSFDALAAGTPVVTCPGRFMRGRQTAAMLRAMGLESLVADSPESLATLAVAVATDAARNRALREQVAARRAAIFGQTDPVHALQQALLRVYTGP